MSKAECLELPGENLDVATGSALERVTIMCICSGCWVISDVSEFATVFQAKERI